MARKNKRKVNIGHLLIVIIGFILVLALFIFLIKSLFSSSTEPSSSTSTKTSETVVSFMGVGDNLIHDTVYNDALQSDGTYDFTKMYSNFKRMPKIAISLLSIKKRYLVEKTLDYLDILLLIHRVRLLKI